MGRFRLVRSLGHTLREKQEKLVFTTLAVATFIFILSVLTQLAEHVSFDESEFHLLHQTAQMAVVFISFSVFFIQRLTPQHSRSPQSMFIGAAFLSVGTLKFFHMATYGGLLPTAAADDSDMSTYFSTSANITLAATLLMACFVPSMRGKRWHSLSTVLLPFIAYTVTVSVVIIVFLDRLPLLLDEGEGGPALRTVIQLAILAAFLAAVFVYRSLGIRTKNVVYSYLSAAAILGANSSIAYMLYADPCDSFSMLAIVYDLACFAMIFVALFRVSVTEPYDELLRAKGVIEKRRREAEAASMKAQTYLDFLSHDIANMISPIMSYAEMIERHEASPQECKKYASRIQDQTKKTSSLISNLRRLARTEKMPAGALSELDLRAYIPEAVREVTAENPGKRVEFVSRFPDTSEVIVVGGGVAEEIVSEVLRNAAKHGCDGTASVQIVVTEATGGSGRAFWHIDVTDHGPGISDTRKKSLLSGTFSEESRMSRGVVSNLPLVSLIAEQLGGRIRIEDRVPGNHTQGAKVVIMLPRARPH